MKKCLLIILVILIAFMCFSCKKANLGEADSKYIMDIILDDNLMVNQTVIIDNVYKDNLTQLKFHLYPNAYRSDAENKAYETNLINYGGIEITKLTVNNKDAYFSLSSDKNIMTIRMPKQKLNDEIKVYMEYKVTIPECNLRLGKYNGVYNLGNFYPVLCFYEDGKWREDKFSLIGDPFMSAIADYEVTLKTASDLIIACTGDIKNSHVDDDIKVTSIKAKSVRDFAIVASNRFNVMTKMVKKTMVYYYYFSDENPNETLNTATNALNLFSKAFGDYPYSSYSVVETPFMHGGMEYPMLVYISSTVSDEDKQDIVIHETAHQWWSVVVGNDSINESYIDEGLATFSTAYYYLLNKEENKFKEAQSRYKSSYLNFVKLKTASDKEYIPSMNRSLYEFTANEYSAICYDKSSVMFQNVYDLIGKRKFEKGLKLFFEKNQYKVASKEDLYSAFNKAAGLDVGKVFETWINGTAQTFCIQ